MDKLANPLTAEPPPEVPLPHAPLVRVIAQLRFPLITALEQRESVGPFQEAVRSKYPVLRQELTHSILIPAGVASQTVQTTWRFTSIDSAWRLSLAPDFIALETTAYTSRGDFLGRFRDVVDLLQTQFEPRLVDRLGVRYVDRLTGLAQGDIARLVRPEVRGLAGSNLEPSTIQTLSQSWFDVSGAKLAARWGLIPPGATFDPAAIEPIKESSWVLDLDMFTEKSEAFSSERVAELSKDFAERIYSFFRWAVTDDFLRRYGGKA